MNRSEKSYWVHERAICDSSHIGEGTRIWGFSHVMAGAKIGTQCNIGEQVFIENDVQIGNGCTIKNGVAIWDKVTLEDDVFVGPCAVFTNDLTPRAFLKRGPSFYAPTRIKKGATIGANATIVCGVTIGAYALVAAGAVVTKNVLDHTLVKGCPAKGAWRVCFCGQRLDKNDQCTDCKMALSQNSAELVIGRIRNQKRLSI